MFNDLFERLEALLTAEFYGNRVGIEIPKIEVRFQNLSIEGDGYVGTRALPTLLNSTLNAVEVFSFFICCPFLLIRVEIFFLVENKVLIFFSHE